MTKLKSQLDEEKEESMKVKIELQAVIESERTLILFLKYLAVMNC